MTVSELQKDVFVIHTEGACIERQYFSVLHEVFADGPLTVWNYDDWSWETLQRDIRKKVYTRKGLEIDPLRWMLRSPKPFVKRGTSLQVARETLRRILRGSSVVIFVEPTTGEPSQGVEFELTELRHILDDTTRPHPRPATIQVMLEPVHPVLTYVSPIDRTRWRTSFYLGLQPGKHATAAQVRDFAGATALTTIIAHFMNRLPYQTNPPLAHRILLRTIEQAGPIDVFGKGIQDTSYLAAAQTHSEELNEMLVAEFTERWHELMSFVSQARVYLTGLESQFGQSETKVVWPFLYHPKSTSCARLFEHLRKPFYQATDRAAKVMEDEVVQRRRFPPDGVLCELDLSAFDADSLERLSGAISALKRLKGSSWDKGVANAVHTAFGVLPPQSLAEALSVMRILHAPPEVQQVGEALLTFAYAVLKHFHHRVGADRPRYYNHFFGEAIIELFGTLRSSTADLVASVEFHDFHTLVLYFTRKCVRC